MTLATSNKFDICLLSGFLFNFACVTAQYWPYQNGGPGQRSYPPSGYNQPGYGANPYGQSGPPGQLVSSGVLRVQNNPLRGAYDPYRPQTGYGYGAQPGYGSSVSFPRSVYPGYPSTSGYGTTPGYSAAPGYGTTPGYGGQPSSRYDPSRPLTGMYSSGNQRPMPGYGYPSTYPGYQQPARPYPGQQYPSPYPSQYPSSYPSQYPPQASPYPGQYPPSPYPSYPPYQQQQPWQNPWDQFQDRRGGPGHGGWPQDAPPGYGRPAAAVAQLRGMNKVEGDVRFVQSDNKFVSITGRIVGLTPGAHGLHVHEKSQKDKNSCDLMEIGEHFNPQNSAHGGKSEWIRHVGDLGNIFADHDGMAYFDITDTMISLGGPNSVINRTLVITETADDLGKGHSDESKRNGNSGKILACGTIMYSQQY